MQDTSVPAPHGNFNPNDWVASLFVGLTLIAIATLLGKRLEGSRARHNSGQARRNDPSIRGRAGRLLATVEDSARPPFASPERNHAMRDGLVRLRYERHPKADEWLEIQRLWRRSLPRTRK